MREQSIGNAEDGGDGTASGGTRGATAGLFAGAHEVAWANRMLALWWPALERAVARTTKHSLTTPFEALNTAGSGSLPPLVTKLALAPGLSFGSRAPLFTAIDVVSTSEKSLSGGGAVVFCAVVVCEEAVMLSAIHWSKVVKRVLLLASRAAASFGF